VWKVWLFRLKKYGEKRRENLQKLVSDVIGIVDKVTFLIDEIIVKINLRLN